MERRRMMWWIGIPLGGLAGLVVVLIVIGSLLPRDHVAALSIELRAGPERVWSLVADLGGTARWRPDVTRVESQSGPSGTLRYVEHSRHGATPFELVSQEPPRRQVVRVVDDGLPFGGTWTWDLVSAGAGTRLTITEAGFIRNPVFRVMSRLFFPPTATMNGYLRALARELGESAEPQAVDAAPRAPE
jgi:uncharacterized protein YndB with AHSA1/START domain